MISNAEYLDRRVDEMLKREAAQSRVFPLDDIIETNRAAALLDVEQEMKRRKGKK